MCRVELLASSLASSYTKGADTLPHREAGDWSRARVLAFPRNACVLCDGAGHIKSKLMRKCNILMTF